MKYLLLALAFLTSQSEAYYGGGAAMSSMASMNNTMLMLRRSATPSSIGHPHGGIIIVQGGSEIVFKSPVAGFQSLPPELAFLKEKPKHRAFWRFGRRLWVGCYAVDANGEIPGRAVYRGGGMWNFKNNGNDRYFLNKFQDNGYSRWDDIIPGLNGEPRIRACFSSQENAVKYALKISRGRR